MDVKTNMGIPTFTVREVCRMLGMSQPTLSRALCRRNCPKNDSGAYVIDERMLESVGSENRKKGRKKLAKDVVKSKRYSIRLCIPHRNGYKAILIIGEMGFNFRFLTLDDVKVLFNGFSDEQYEKVFSEIEDGETSARLHQMLKREAKQYSTAQ